MSIFINEYKIRLEDLKSGLDYGWSAKIYDLEREKIIIARGFEMLLKRSGILEENEYLEIVKSKGD